MFSSSFLARPARYRAFLGPSGSSPSRLRACCFSPSCLSLIPAAHSVSNTVSRSKPSKQILSSHCWLSAVRCRLQLPSPAAQVRETPHEPLRSASLSSAPPTARRSTKAAPLSPLGATLTKNTGEGTKRCKEESRSTHASIVTRRNPTYSLYFQRLRNNYVHNGGWGYPGANRNPGRRMRAPSGTGNWTTWSGTRLFASRFALRDFS
jgi:hypothetical protein